MAERDFKGIWMPKEIWLADDIGWSAKLLLVEIDSLEQNGECFASNDYFAQFFSLSKDRISKLISELREKGYVEVKIIYKENSKQIEKRVLTTIGYRRKCLQGIGASNDTPMGENNYTPIGENAKDNNTSFINTSFINTEIKRETESAIPSAPPPPPKKEEKEKPQKHKYGEYQRVLLTDGEVEKLQKDFGEAETAKAITFLDEYIEMKGYKANSHYLAIRKWVFDAVREQEHKNAKNGKPANKSFDTDDFFAAALNKSYKTAAEDDSIRQRAEQLRKRVGQG